MLSKLTSNGKLLRFLLVGGCNTLLGFGLFPAIYWLIPDLRKHYMWILVSTHIINVLWAYFANKYFVFRTQGRVLNEMTKFVSFHLLCFLIMILAVPFFVELAHIHPPVIQFSVSVLVVISSYFWYDKIVFFYGWK